MTLENSNLTMRQQDAIEQRPGEDNYEFLARGWRTLRFKDLPQLLHMRSGDRNQVEAIKLYVDLRMVVWTRALAFGTVILGACTIVAAFIAS